MKTGIILSKYHRAIIGRVLRFMCTIFIARRKCIDLLFSLQYQEVFQRVHQPSVERKHQNYGGLLQSGILIDLLIPV